MCTKPWSAYVAKWRSMKHWTNIFCFVSLANYISLFVLAVYPLADALMSSMYTNPSASTEFSFVVTRTMTFVTITVFQVVHAWYGLFHDNIYEIYANLMAQVIITVVIVFRCASDFHWGIYEYALFSYSLLFQALYIIFMFLIHSEYSYTFYVKAGADPTFRSMYRKYLRYQAILKIDFMLALISTMSFETSSGQWQFLITFNLVIAILGIIYYGIGRFAVSHEMAPLVVVFWGLSGIQLVFYGYGIWFLAFHRQLLIWNNFTSLIAASASLFIASAIAGSITRLVLFILSIFAFNNFGKGIIKFNKKNQKTLKIDEETKPLKNDYQHMEPRANDDEGITVDDVISNTKHRKFEGEDSE